MGWPPDSRTGGILRTGRAHLGYLAVRRDGPTRLLAEVLEPVREWVPCLEAPGHTARTLWDYTQALRGGVIGLVFSMTISIRWQATASRYNSLCSISSAIVFMSPQRMHRVGQA
jgi:hypothetical protein